jgi:hypothetical protein
MGLKCLICGKEIKQDKHGFWYGGTPFNISPGYGSHYDMSDFEAVICDDCLLVKIESGVLFDLNGD